MGKRLGRSAIPIGAALLVLGFAENVQASGFQLFDQSPSGQGNAFAGAAAAAEDASTIFFNPAGMSNLSGYQTEAGVQIILPSLTLHPTKATTAGGAPLTGPQSVDGGSTAFIPNFYVMAPLGDRARVGFGIESPFGLETDYGENWIGRYYAEESNLRTLNFNPSVSYKMADWISVGAGLDIMYSDVFLSNAVDFGTIFAAGGFTPQSQDGQLKLQANTVGFGWNAGIMLQPLDHTRLGLSYRSPVHLGFDGQAHWSAPTAIRTFQALIGNTAFQSGGAHASINLPETVSAAVAQELDSKWTLLGDVTWTHWDRFQALSVGFDNPVQPPIVIPESWHDTFREALGVTYKATDKAKLRLGVAYDPTPTKSSTRDLRIPDTDRFWLSVGYNLHLIDNLSLDAAYTHIFALTDGAVNLTSATQGNVSGTYSAEVNIFAVGFKYTF
ncbi:MAG TPA: outer membrane protein transport protein [Alphaproteobacteria bacterium]|nr:outer membrane protein transport protein [Alphaproteobacteria bacterium]